MGQVCASLNQRVIQGSQYSWLQIVVAIAVVSSRQIGHSRGGEIIVRTVGEGSERDFDEAGGVGGRTSSLLAFWWLGCLAGLFEKFDNLRKSASIVSYSKFPHLEPIGAGTRIFCSNIRASNSCNKL